MKYNKYDSFHEQCEVTNLIIITCVDNQMGMLFNHRRQSQDRILRDHILKQADSSRLLMNSYSAKQFESSTSIHIDEHFLSNAAPDDICFVEDCHVAPFESQITKIILYKWNRNYPADLYFDIPLTEHGWQLISTKDFAGSSHEKITEEVYTK